MNVKEYEATVAANTPEGYPNLVAGWPDEEHDITWDAYIEWGHDVMDDVAEGDDIGAFQTFEEYKQQERDANTDRDYLGFSYENCDLCGALPGDRHAVTAYPEDVPNNLDYVALSVCSDCLMFVANAELPHYLED